MIRSAPALDWLCQATCWSLYGPEYLSGGPSGRSRIYLRFLRTASQAECSQLSATSWIVLSCASGQLLPWFWAVRQSVTMVSHHDLCASSSRGSQQPLLWRCLMRAGSLVTLKSAPRQSVCRLAERGSEGIELKQSRLVGLRRESRPMKLLSMAFKSG